MALFIDNTARLMIPSWRELNKSKAELCPVGAHLNPTPKGDIQEYLIAWRENRNIVTAGELISAAIVNGLTEEPAVTEAAQFVVDFPLNVPKALQNVSKGLLQIPEEPEMAMDLPIFVKIAQLKKLLWDYPTAAILHVEIARLYMLLGQLDIAERHIHTALYFDHHNRFVTRSASRFFIHRGYEDEALGVLRRSGLIKKDPWLMASEISVSRHFDARPQYIKRAFELIDSKNYSNYDLSELCGTVGFEELEAAGYKKSRKLFNQSLKAATDNSFAQAKWVAENRGLELIFPNAPINTNFKEALCYEQYFVGKYKSALQYALEWQAEMPYSMKCVMFGSGISTIFEKDYKTSIQMLETYLKTNQRNKAALNDLAYAYALNKQPIEAQKKLEQALRLVDTNNLEDADICLIATEGLILFRHGDVANGSELYEKAIEACRRRKREDMEYSAILNYAREILRHDNNEKTREKVTSLIQGIPEPLKGTEHYELLKEVRKRLGQEKMDE